MSADISRLVTRLELALIDLPVFHQAALVETIALITQLEADARRYRWLRDPDNAISLDALLGLGAPEQLDAAIDAAGGETK